MPTTETLEDFYRQKFNQLPPGPQQDPGHFNVFRIEDSVGLGKPPMQYSRREFYKISLVRGHQRYHYADKSIEAEGTTLLFFNPTVPYKMEQAGGPPTGRFCIFKDAFFTEHIRGSLKDLPMFAPGGKPAYMLDSHQDQYINAVFDKMLDEISSGYRFKYDLIRNYIMEIVHYALKMEPAENLYEHTDANARITAVFTELLERQFPIESPAQQFSLRSAKDFARQLNVHVNHLNRAIRNTTGKTTTAHIFERLISEAKALLKHTDWNVSEISYCLGFEEPAHFNHFFKKQTSTTPTAFRS
ncbi:MAG: transcriptional regulator [Ferruginibacter sp.]|uniref:helix-turn-helix domain-containing protein n=1 Tax=Ferruginibacter sp. TaxID=1940288 RepID=UPI002658AC1C|nr:AraC family transcriptional regulator [Ferruginibacter sp.]MDB5279193.1 transcriptional regulator [Ferruginibacter sp.]